MITEEKKDSHAKRVKDPVEERFSERYPSLWIYAMILIFIGLTAASGYYFSRAELSKEEKEALAAFEKSKKTMVLLSEKFNAGASHINHIDTFTEATEKVIKIED